MSLCLALFNYQGKKPRLNQYVQWGWFVEVIDEGEGKKTTRPHKDLIDLFQALVRFVVESKFANFGDSGCANRGTIPQSIRRCAARLPRQ